LDKAEFCRSRSLALSTLQRHLRARGVGNSRSQWRSSIGRGAPDA
jgi:hypothetical protein